MVRYTAWLALLGTVATSSLQPYFSAMNKFFRDHQRQPIAVGELLANARRGLEMIQHRILPTASRLPLSAPVALDILKAADALRGTFTWTHAALPQLQRFRACLAIYINYSFFLPRRSWRPLPYRRPSGRQAFPPDLPLRAQIKRRPAPRHQRQARHRYPYRGQLGPGRPARLLHATPHRVLPKILQPASPCRLLELLTC